MLAIQTPTKIDQGLRDFDLEAKKNRGPGFTSRCFDLLASNSWRDLGDGEGIRGEGGLYREGGLRGEEGLAEKVGGYFACMHTRSQTRNLHNQQHLAPPHVVEQFNLEEPVENPPPPLALMDDQRTMAQLLEAPTAGYEDAIVVPEIAADNFELKHGLLNLVQNKQFFGHDKEDPHAHIRYFNKITSTMKFPNVPSTSVKLMLFPFSLEGAARKPPRSIQTWDDLVSKFINKFFPPSKTTNLSK
ncbi:hypothetical protein Tco_0873028 [Tanacetum coccineum]